MVDLINERLRTPTPKRTNTSPFEILSHPPSMYKASAKRAHTCLLELSDGDRDSLLI